MKPTKSFLSQLAVTSHLMVLLLLEDKCTNLLPAFYTASFRGLQGVSGARLRNGSEEMEQEHPENTSDMSMDEMEGVVEGASVTQPGAKRQQQQPEILDSASCSSEACTPSTSDGAGAKSPSVGQEPAYLFSYSDSSDSSDAESSPRPVRKQAKGVQTPFPQARSVPPVTRSQQNSPAGLAEARTTASQVSMLLRPLSTKRSTSAGWFRRSRRRLPALPLLVQSVKAFLLPVPRRRTGFQEQMKSYSAGAVNVVRHVSGLLPMKIRSALHDGATKTLSVDWTHPVIYSPGRVSVCANFEGDENSPPLYLTMLFIEDRKHLGQDAARLMYRVAAAQQLAIRAGLRRAADVATAFHMGTPVDVVPLGTEEVILLDSTLLSGKALLEPRLWAPLTSVLRRIDQAEGMQNIRMADQARSSLTRQVVEVVSGIRANKFVLPRVIPEDFWLDEGGQLFYLPRDITNLWSEGDLIKSSAAAGQGGASESTSGENATAAASTGEERLDERSNSVALGLFIMQMWCRLTPELMRAQTPAREKAARLVELDFSSCISGMPQEVKELVVQLHGGKLSNSIPTAQAVSSRPYLTLQERLEYAEALEKGTQSGRARHPRRAAGATGSISARVRRYRRHKTV